MTVEKRDQVRFFLREVKDELGICRCRFLLFSWLHCNTGWEIFRAHYHEKRLLMKEEGSMFGVEGVSIVIDPEMFAHLRTQQVVILDGSIVPLSPEYEEALCTFVERGGGLVCLGNAVEVYYEYPLLSEVLGHVRGRCTPPCEIIATIATPDSYLTRRVDPSFSIFEAIYLLEGIPADAQILWRTIWHYVPYTLAYTRSYGQGRVFCTTIGNTAEAQAQPIFRQMIGRAIKYVAGAETREHPARVAMIGYGAIGFEHGTAITNVAGLEYALVCDRNEERLAAARAAFPEIQTCTDLSEVEANPDIDLVIVSTPPNTHASISMQMLRAGKHVVAEKPFCLTTAEADEMMMVARNHERVLTVYQCRRWDPDYLAIQQVLQNGTIGSVFHMETFIGGYAHPCSYWHSHEPISGGVFYDWGSHYLDWILQLIPDRVVNVRGVEHKRVWHDVTNADQSSVYLHFAGGQEAEFMHSDIAAVMKPKWYILGEKGAVVGHWRQESVKTRRWSGDLIEERLAPSEALPDVFVATRDKYGSIHQQHLALPAMPFYPFHRNLANHLHCGEALAVLPQEARRNIAVMEAAKRSAEHGGEVIALDC
ncbi:MAG: Gfo/Idh/MocA family oxidoreductase [Chloroflexota bacterium]|nr:Gfo/Idh/MocA family oxidoreductase [Chloroflexota bacterium]